MESGWGALGRMNKRVVLRGEVCMTWSLFEWFSASSGDQKCVVCE
jgi:hypothetical protein